MPKYDGTNYSYLKWATQNLAVTNSGRAQWNNTNYQICDYFQWAASYEGYGIEEEASKVPTNLVIYDSFTNTFAGGESDAFTVKDSKRFDEAFAPYGGTSYSYSKYTGTSGDGKTKESVRPGAYGVVFRYPLSLRPNHKFPLYERRIDGIKGTGSGS